MIVWSPVGAGEGCECGVIKPAVKHIQITSKLRVLNGVGGGFLIVGNVLQASPHWRRVVSWKPDFQLFRVASLCYSDLLRGILRQSYLFISSFILIRQIFIPALLGLSTSLHYCCVKMHSSCMHSSCIYFFRLLRPLHCLYCDVYSV